MIYVKNNIKFAVMFKVEKDGVKKVYEFDCRRVYQDTGNVVTTGVTPIAEDDFEWLYENCKQFKDHVDQGLLVKTRESGATTMANQMDALAKENAVLKAKLAEKVKNESLGIEKEETTSDTDSLKTQLEKTKKSKKAKVETEVDESEGF